MRGRAPNRGSRSRATPSSRRPPAPAAARPRTRSALPPEQIVAMLSDYLLSLPADRFPHVHRAIGDLFGGDPDERFEFGLDILVRGIGTYARPGAARNGEAEQGR